MGARGRRERKGTNVVEETKLDQHLASDFGEVFGGVRFGKPVQAHPNASVPRRCKKAEENGLLLVSQWQLDHLPLRVPAVQNIAANLNTVGCRPDVEPEVLLAE